MTTSMTPDDARRAEREEAERIVSRWFDPQFHDGLVGAIASALAARRPAPDERTFPAAPEIAEVLRHGMVAVREQTAGTLGAAFLQRAQALLAKIEGRK